MNQAVAGVLALLFCTTHLHYTQNMMENNYILFLTLTGFKFHRQWLLTCRRRDLLLGSGAFGLSLLTRLTVVLDLMAGGLFLLLILYLEGARGSALRQRRFTFIQVALPVYSFFLLLDRLYQFYRFGSFFNTYVGVVARDQRILKPALSPNYPFETPFRVGFLGPLITPEKSVFLFDPLLLLTIIVVALAWKYFRPEVKAYLISSLLLLLAYISFYAKYTVWSGDSAWGDRYVSTAVELAAFISVPLLLRYRERMQTWVLTVGFGLIVISALIQSASLAFWLPLEIYQMTTLGHPTLVIALRFQNIVAFEMGKMDKWGLTNSAMTKDTWDFVRITTWNFLPFVLRRVGEAPPWVVSTLLAIWSTAVAMLAWVLWQLRKLSHY